jgi:hypothetical protein
MKPTFLKTLSLALATLSACFAMSNAYADVIKQGGFNRNDGNPDEFRRSYEVFCANGSHAVFTPKLDRMGISYYVDSEGKYTYSLRLADVDTRKASLESYLNVYVGSAYCYGLPTQSIDHSKAIGESYLADSGLYRVTCADDSQRMVRIFSSYMEKKGVRYYGNSSEPLYFYCLKLADFNIPKDKLKEYLDVYVGTPYCHGFPSVDLGGDC